MLRLIDPLPLGTKAITSWFSSCSDISVMSKYGKFYSTQNAPVNTHLVSSEEDIVYTHVHPTHQPAAYKEL